MSNDPVHPTGDPENPWGMNRTPTDPPLYKGREIPVVDASSSKEDLLRYIRILEDRLHLTHVYVQRPKGVSSDVEELGVQLPHDLPPEEKKKLPVIDLVRVSQNQAERVDMLSAGIDRVGGLQIGEAFYRKQALGDLDPN